MRERSSVDRQGTAKRRSPGCVKMKNSVFLLGEEVNETQLEHPISHNLGRFLWRFPVQTDSSSEKESGSDSLSGRLAPSITDLSYILERHFVH